MQVKMRHNNYEKKMKEWREDDPKCCSLQDVLGEQVNNLWDLDVMVQTLNIQGRGHEAHVQQ